MSTVRDYYKDHRSWNDDLHKLLDKEPGLLAQLPGLRARALACCGAEPSTKNGEIKLVVADPAGWDKIAGEQAAVQQKLDAINKMVEVLDGIFAEMEAAGIEADDRTIRGIWSIEESRRTLVTHPDTGTTSDPWGHPVPQKRDAKLVAWGEAAEKALKEAQATVG